MGVSTTSQFDIQLLYQISRQLATTLELDDVLKRIIKLTVQVLEAQTGSIYLLNSDGRLIRQFLCESEHQLPSELFRTSFAGWVYANQKASIITNTMTDPRWLTLSTDVQGAEHSVIGVPMMRRNRVIGVIIIGQNSPNFFQAEHLQLLEAITNQAAAATENAALYTRANTERSVLRAVISGVQDTILVTDLQNRLILANPVAIRSLCLPDHFSGQLINEVLFEPAILNFFQIIVEESTDVNREIQLLDGRVFDCALRLVPNIGKVLSMHDVSTFKRLDGLKSEFVSQVAHDLKAPLGVIYGYAWLLNEAPKLDIEERGYVSEILSAVQRMRNLIDNILDLGRIEMGIEAEFVVTQLEPILTNAQRNHATAAQHRHIQLTTQLAPSLPAIWGAPLRLEIAVNNFLSNALKFTPVGGKVELSAFLKQDWVVVRVKDSGPGIPEHLQTRLFQKFSKLGQLETEQQEGHGLGLAIVKRIIDAHHGNVWVESTVGVGSSFCFALPVYTAESQDNS
jgi:two-component system phosphate regulon sensor histidine kinase PhoR